MRTNYPVLMRTSCPHADGQSSCLMLIYARMFSSMGRGSSRNQNTAGVGGPNFFLPGPCIHLYGVALITFSHFKRILNIAEVPKNQD